LKAVTQSNIVASRKAIMSSVMTRLAISILSLLALVGCDGTEEIENVYALYRDSPFIYEQEGL